LQKTFTAELAEHAENNMAFSISYLTDLCVLGGGIVGLKVYLKSTTKEKTLCNRLHSLAGERPLCYPCSEKGGGMKEAVLHKLNSYCGNMPDILLAYLFGSRASGKVGKLSDYDIAVFLKGGFHPDLKYRLGSELGKILGTARIDLVVLNNAPIELRYNVIVTGALIYERDRAERVEFEATTLSRYFDLLPLLRRQRREVISGEGYGNRVQRYRAALRKTEKLLGKIRAAQGKG
jgi:hypothetical protein